KRAVTSRSPKRDGPGSFSRECQRLDVGKALRQSRTGGGRRRMASFKLFGAALILSTSFATPVFAQVPLPGDYSSEPVYSSEPGVLTFYHPNGNLRPVQRGRVDARRSRPPARPRRADR